MKDHKTLLFLASLSLIFLVVSCTEDDDQAVVEYTSSLAGIYDAEARMFGPVFIDCPDTIWQGQVRWTAEHLDEDSVGIYRIYSRWDAQDIWLEDPVMGSYYQCYSHIVDDPSGLSNGANGEGVLRIHDDDGLLRWYGYSQWGEVYQFLELEVYGVILFLRFQNDFNEIFDLRLIRTDGTSWPEELSIE